MRFVLDALYLLFLIVASPVWLTRLCMSGKWRTDWAGRFGRGSTPPSRTHAGQSRVLLHAVSVGEVNALRTLVHCFEQHHPDVQLAICVTTNTGIARAQSLFGERHHVCRFPLDFSWAVQRFLSRIDPDVVALIELEVWPNFTSACARRNVGLCVINGRLSERSHRRYRRARFMMRRSFARLDFAAVQSEEYARRFIDMDVPADRVHVTDTMKWDAAAANQQVACADELAGQLGIDRSKPLIVAGSTAPDEHALLVAATPPGAQLLCAPRRPEWFDQAAADMPGCARRSRSDCGSDTGRFLLDTLGELHAAYTLADVVVIGRSFGSLYGSDMMEPVALGKATVVGPAVADFQDTVDALLAGGGLIQTTRDELSNILADLIANPQLREQVAARGRRVIASREGASARHAAMIMDLVAQKTRRPSRNWDDEGGERRKSRESPRAED